MNRILYQVGDFTVRPAVFGRRRSPGFEVYRDGLCVATCVATIGYPGPDGLARAIAKADALHGQSLPTR